MIGYSDEKSSKNKIETWWQWVVIKIELSIYF